MKTELGVTIVGVPLDNVTMQSAIDRIEGYIEEGGFHQVATANVNFLANSLRHPELQRVLGTCDMVVADGMPLLWISKHFHMPLQERVTGVDMVPAARASSPPKRVTASICSAPPKPAPAPPLMNWNSQYPGVPHRGPPLPAHRSSRRDGQRRHPTPHPRRAPGHSPRRLRQSQAGDLARPPSPSSACARRRRHRRRH